MRNRFFFTGGSVNDSIGYKIHFKLFEHKCVLEVCVHIHPIIIQIHPVLFKIPFLKSGCQNDVVLYRPLPQ